MVRMVLEQIMVSQSTHLHYSILINQHVVALKKRAGYQTLPVAYSKSLNEYTLYIGRSLSPQFIFLLFHQRQILRDVKGA